jgi:hypothetical protein
MDTSIYTEKAHRLLPQMVNVWVDAQLSRRRMKGVSSQVYRLFRQYSFQISPSLKKGMISASAFHILCDNKSW